MHYLEKIPHGIMFHHFHGGAHFKGQGSISQETFDKILNSIGVEKFLSPDEWLEKLEKKTLHAQNFCLTFDDGLLCQKDIALPVLDHYKLKAFWFVYSSVFEGKTENLEIYRLFRTNYFQKMDDFYDLFFSRVGRKLNLYEKEFGKIRREFPFYTENDIKFRLLRDRILGKKNYEKIMDGLLEEYGCDRSVLAKHLWMSNENLESLSEQGHQMGLHSYSHPTKMEELSYAKQLEEYQKNYDHLKVICGKKPLAMSHPCNSYNKDTLTILRELGIRLGFRANVFPKEEDDVLNKSELEMARQDHANLLLTVV